MRKFVLLFAGLLLFFFSFSQSWSQDQLDSANTAKDINEITSVEKEAILYINLARLYPQLFARIEVEKYTGTDRYVDYVKKSSYRTSLITELKKRKPTAALQFDKSLYNYAKCFAKELGNDGKVTHERKTCVKGTFAECCSYGMDTGKDIVMQWLIDDKISNVGHRINCLNPLYTKIGIGFHTHTVWHNCAVADLFW
jgi:hypothetical protein